jgi:hypothetical protein
LNRLRRNVSDEREKGMGARGNSPLQFGIKDIIGFKGPAAEDRGETVTRMSWAEEHISETEIIR